MEKIVNAANVRKISWANNTLRFYFDNRQIVAYKDTTVGLWATDRPDLIPKEIKDLFFEITFENREVVR